VPPPTRPADPNRDGLWTIEELMANVAPTTFPSVRETAPAAHRPTPPSGLDPNGLRSVEAQMAGNAPVVLLSVAEIGSAPAGVPRDAQESDAGRAPPSQARPTDRAIGNHDVEADHSTDDIGDTPEEKGIEGTRREEVGSPFVETRGGFAPTSMRRNDSPVVGTARSSSSRVRRARAGPWSRTARWVAGAAVTIAFIALGWLSLGSPWSSLPSEPSTVRTSMPRANAASMARPTKGSPASVAAAPPAGLRPPIFPTTDERTPGGESDRSDRIETEIADLHQALDVLAGDVDAEQRQAAIRFLGRHGPDTEAYDYLEELDQRRPSDATDAREVLMAQSRLRRALCASWADDPRREAISRLGCPDAR
jgi:hypothetical protein